MDIHAATVPAPNQASAKGADKAQARDKSDSVHERTESEHRAHFSQLLQGWRQGDAQAIGDELQEMTLQEVAPGEALAAVLSVDELLGQTQHLQGADAHTPAVPAQGVAVGAQAHVGVGVGVGQQVATVAAGVQLTPQAYPTTGSLDAPAVVQSAASALLAQAVDTAVANEPLAAGDAQTQEDGRFTLEGNWTLDDAHTDWQPALQRVVAQVEQWASASAGIKPKPGERADGSRSTQPGSVDALGTGQGSGTRLMDNAVREAQPTQDAMWRAPQEAPTQDMRFWLQGKQQRAEVVLHKDGQPVRVQVAVRGNEAHVTFQADQAQTRELLDSHVVQLREMLAQQGVELAGVQVQAQAQGDTASNPQGPRNAWQEAPARHGVVHVPQDALEASGAAAGQRVLSLQGLDLYA